MTARPDRPADSDALTDESHPGTIPFSDEVDDVSRIAGKHRLLLIGTGDLPARLLPLLEEDSWEVAGIRRSDAPIAGAPEGRVEMHRGDAADESALEPLFRARPNAAIVTVSPPERTEAAYEQTYLDTARSVARVAGGLSPETHLVFVSSTSVYGQDAGEIVDESSETRPSRPTAGILLEAERAITASGLPWSVVRFSGIYGPGRERLVNRIREGVSSNAAAAWTNRIHAEDCARVLHFVLTADTVPATGAGVLLATDNEPALRHDVEAWIAKQLGVALSPRGRTDAPARGKRCDNARLRSLGFQPKYPDYRAGYAEILQDGEGR